MPLMRGRVELSLDGQPERLSPHERDTIDDTLA